MARVTVATAMLATPTAAQAPYTLRLAPVGAPVLSVVDPTAAPGHAINPFDEECVARLMLFGPDAQRLQILDDRATRDAVRVYPTGRRGLGAHPGWVDISDAGVVTVLLAPHDSRARYTVRLESFRVAGGPTGLPSSIESEPFTVPETEVVRCGRTPAASFDLLQSAGGADGLALGLDVVRRGAFASARGGFWELFADGVAATSPTEQLTNSWKAGGRFEVKVTEGYEHWVGVGGVFRFEGDEDFDVVDRVMGASLRVRLDFLGIDAFLTPLLARYAPYPMVVVEYNHVVRDESIPAGVSPGPPVDHRIKGRLDWTVPLLFDTTLRVELQGDLLLGDLPTGDDERWRPLADLSLEYPLNEAGDVTAVVTRLAGETAPLYDPIARYLFGFGIRR